MNVLSPIWLIGFAPWLTLAIWMFRGRGELRRVPFLQLWAVPVATPKPARAQRPPPLAVLLALLALLLGVIAAGRLAIGRRQQIILNVVVDRGITMSSPGLPATCGALWNELAIRWPSCRVNLIAVPGETQLGLDLDSCRRATDLMSPTAVDTRAAIAQISRPNLIVVSNQPVPATAIQIPPLDDANDVGIISLALATQPRLQLMVGIRNRSSLSSATLQIETDGRRIEQPISLPPRGEAKNAFVDLKSVGDVISATLNVHDDIPANDRAWLARENQGARPDARTPLTPELERLTEVYRQKRVGASVSRTIPIVADAADFKNAEAGIVLSHASNQVLAEPIQIVANPVTDYVDWKSLPRVVSVGSAPEGWTPIVIFSGHPAVAINPQHPRQVWVGLDASSWSRTKEFVIFWTNVLDYAGGGDDRWTSHPLSEWTPEWKLDRAVAGEWPGVYKRSDGAKRAFNPSDVPLTPPIQSDWKSKLAALQPESAAGEIAPALLIGALGLLALFALRY